MRCVIECVLSEGVDIYPTKGKAKELSGVFLEIKNPLARISRTEIKGKPFSCLGELLWYLAGRNHLAFISYYLPEYRSYADGDQIFGGYGPRLFNWKNVNQFNRIIEMLTRKRDSRQAVIQLFDSRDLDEAHKDIPCTCTLQFMIRRDRLHMITYMRSNDVWIGLPHDVFCFTMLQEIMARSLSVELGTYKHLVGSLHLYRRSFRDARRFLEEGWQPTETVMSPMPKGDPFPSIRLVLAAEEAIRTGQEFNKARVGALNAYWADLVRLLLVFRSYKDKDRVRIRRLRTQMSSTVYHSFIDRRAEMLS